jgi:hypothetical protein
MESIVETTILTYHTFTSLVKTLPFVLLRLVRRLFVFLGREVARFEDLVKISFELDYTGGVLLL